MTNNTAFIVFISWAPYCSRSDSIAYRLGGKSYMIYSPFWGSRYATILFKYFVQMCRTLRVVFRDRPRAVFVMSPPVIACLPVWLYSLVARVPFVIDAHTGAFTDSPWNRLRWLQKFFSRRALTTIVTNDHLASIVREWGADATIITDVPVLFAEPRVPDVQSSFSITVVNSFAPDEPLEQILDAAASLPEVQFFITGSPNATCGDLLTRAPNNVEFTGFLDDADYVGRLLASDAVMVLTTRDHTMQRGAYEAVYLEKPVITSDFALLKRAFDKGTVHVKPVADDIVRGINEMVANIHVYQEEVRLLRAEKCVAWEKAAVSLLSRLGLPSDDLKEVEPVTAKV